MLRLMTLHSPAHPHTLRSYETSITNVIENLGEQAGHVDWLGDFVDFRGGSQLRVLLSRGLCGWSVSPFYRFAQKWGRGEERGVKYKSSQQTSNNGVRLLITVNKMYENREMDKMIQNQYLLGLRTREAF